MLCIDFAREQEAFQERRVVPSASLHVHCLISNPRSRRRPHRAGDTRLDFDCFDWFEGFAPSATAGRSFPASCPPFNIHSCASRSAASVPIFPFHRFP